MQMCLVIIIILYLLICLRGEVLDINTWVAAAGKMECEEIGAFEAITLGRCLREQPGKRNPRLCLSSLVSFFFFSCVWGFMDVVLMQRS